jgi:nitrite reductase (NADH) small subunit
MSLSVWTDIGLEDEVPARGARRFMIGETPIAVFRSGDGGVFALMDQCPHKKGPLSEGIVHGRAVSCPLHAWVISLETGEAQGADSGCTTTFPVRIEDGRLLVDISRIVQASALHSAKSAA